jgi:hypothetical protein
MKRIYLHPLLYVLLAVTALALTGCKSPAVLTDDADDDAMEDSYFSARQDTVRVQSYVDDTGTAERTPAEPGRYFTVQLGAYKQPANAEQAYRNAMRRFSLETNTEYDPADELYKITVGIFADYDTARTFCDRIIRDYPSDYADAWVVEITQRQRRKIP